MAYNATAPATQQLQNFGVMTMSWANDMLTVLAAFQEQGKTTVAPSAGADTLGDAFHCSGFLRLLPGNADIYISHDTWAGLQSMLRIYKTYDMPFASVNASTYGKPIPAQRITFSSYPGTLYSGDDFYMTTAGLAVIETTLGTYNKTLLGLINPLTVMDWMRNMASNRLATSGQEWASFFRQHNSGTYNNQVTTTQAA